MLVIVVDDGPSAAGDFDWGGRRHDDIAPEGNRGTSAVDLFDLVFPAVLVGEQVAIGFKGPLTRPVADDSSRSVAADLAGADAAEARAGQTQLDALLAQLGRWRPWTTVTTTLSTWTPTTSILLWQVPKFASPAAEPASVPVETGATVSRFFRSVRAADGVEPGIAKEPVLNLAAAAALRAGLEIDPAELARPVFVPD